MDSTTIESRGGDGRRFEVKHVSVNRNEINTKETEKMRRQP
jgi:hypothetical protein